MKNIKKNIIYKPFIEQVVKYIKENKDTIICNINQNNITFDLKNNHDYKYKNFAVSLDIVLPDNINELYIPPLFANYASLNLNIKTNAKKIYCEYIGVENLKINGINENDIEEINIESSNSDIIDFSYNKSLVKLNLNANNAKAKTLILSYTNLQEFKTSNIENFKKIITEGSEIKSISLGTYSVYISMNITLLAANSKLKEIILPTDVDILFDELDVENTNLEKVPALQVDLLNIKNCCLSEKDKKNILKDNKYNLEGLKCDEEDKEYFYQYNSAKFFVYKYDDTAFRFFLNSKNKYNQSIDDIRFKINSDRFFDNKLTYSQRELECKKIIQNYRQLTGNTKLMLEIESGASFESIARKKINNINDYNRIEINKHNRQNKSVIHYTNDLEIYKKLISLGYKLIKSDINLIENYKIKVLAESEYIKQTTNRKFKKNKNIEHKVNLKKIY